MSPFLSQEILEGRGFEPHRHHYVVSLSKNINPSLVLVQPRKTRPFITERLLMGRKESKQTNKQKPVLSGHSKIDKTKVLKTNGSLMKVESSAECSFGAFYNTFDLH